MRTNFSIYVTLLIIFVLTFQVFNTSSALSSKHPCVNYFDSLIQRDVYTLVEEPPSVEEGFQKLLEKISKNIHFGKWNGYETKLLIAFIIDTDGEIIGERIIKNPFDNDKAAKEAFNIIKGFKWLPGLCGDKKVPVLFKLPIQIDFK
jgi:hypothetical protein